MFWLLLRALAAVRRALGLIGRGFGGLGGFDWLRVWLGFADHVIMVGEKFGAGSDPGCSCSCLGSPHLQYGGSSPGFRALG